METMPVISTFEYRKRLYLLHYFQETVFRVALQNLEITRTVPFSLLSRYFGYFYLKKKLRNKMLRMRCIRPDSSNETFLCLVKKKR